MTNNIPPKPDEWDQLHCKSKAGTRFIYMRRERVNNHNEFHNVDLVLDERHPDHLVPTQKDDDRKLDYKFSTKRTQVPDEYLESGAYRIGNGPIKQLTPSPKQLSLFKEK